MTKNYRIDGGTLEQRSPRGRAEGMVALDPTTPVNTLGEAE